MCVCFVFDSYGLHLTLEAPVQSLQGGAASKKPESWWKWFQICYNVCMIKINWATKYLYHLPSLYTFAIWLYAQSLCTRGILFSNIFDIVYVYDMYASGSILYQLYPKIDQNCMDGRLPFTRVPIKIYTWKAPFKGKTSAKHCEKIPLQWTQCFLVPPRELSWMANNWTFHWFWDSW